MFCARQVPAGDFGLVLFVAGVGGLLGGVCANPLARRFGRGPVLVGGSLVAGLAPAAMGFTTNGYVGATLFAVAAFGVMQWNVITMSLRQALIPHELFGRVQGAYRTVVWGSIPLGALLGGLLAHVFGIPTTFVIAGGGLVVMALVLARLVRTHRAALVTMPELELEPIS